MSFSRFGLCPQIIKAIGEMGFSQPTPIQEKALPLLLQGEDLIGQAQTGTGKTATFGIAILEKLAAEGSGGRKTRALVLAPTRELAVQISDEISKIGAHLPFRTAAIYGGQEIDKQIRLLDEGVDIVVGTPGRILDHMERGTLSLSEIRIVVLDEADRMLDMGFIDDIEKILQKTPKSRQTLLFSATMPAEILALGKKYMNSPQEVLVSEDSLSVKSIKQHYVEVSKFDKLNAFLVLLSQKKPKLALVFVRTKRGAERLNQILQDRGFSSMALHGDMSQNKRDRSMEAFRKSHVNILVATDLASRGLDITGVTHVFNYDMTDDPYVYLHRIGRTGRMGKNGEAISLVFFDQTHLVKMVENLAGCKIEPLRVEIKQELIPRRKSFSASAKAGADFRKSARHKAPQKQMHARQHSQKEVPSRGHHYFGRGR
ncbi:MAG: DEAD/DEAH box helicase [Candidatus Micrarchaeota archaeon]|nr:DEAD/DEAH box helicase [Candidatus Micrarchaeota archaeon]